MTYTTPKTWGGSEVLTSGDMNTYVGSNVDYLYDNKPEANQFKAVGTNVSQANQRLESGVETIALSTGSLGSIAFTFNTAYGTAPRMFATVGSTAGANNAFWAGVDTVGTGGGKLWVRSAGGTTTSTLYINWLAIGA